MKDIKENGFFELNDKDLEHVTGGVGWIYVVFLTILTIVIKWNV